MTLAAASVAARFHAAESEAPKHARLRAAIITAVKAGDFSAGTKIPGERELSQFLGVSLGTTQKALGRLVDDGFLVRRQGQGTFVGSLRKPVAGSWHYRFVTEDGEGEMPVFTTVLDRKLIQGDGPWSSALGDDRKGYVVVRRRLDVGDKFACCSRLYLSASRFSRLLRVADKRLTDANLKTVLESDFAAPTLSAEGVAVMVPLEAEDAAVVGAAPSTIGLQIDIVGRSFGRAPITFQRMIVPPSPYGLKLDFNPPDGGSVAAG
ncbi:MAG TPA: GntR family transcriptional regulator [Stellaceae bacterium]